MTDDIAVRLRRLEEDSISHHKQLQFIAQCLRALTSAAEITDARLDGLTDENLTKEAADHG